MMGYPSIDRPWLKYDSEEVIPGKKVGLYNIRATLIGEIEFRMLEIC